MAHSHGAQGLSSIDYMAYSSHLSDVNTGLKIGFSVFLIVLCIATRSIPVGIFSAIVCACLVVLIGKTKLHHYLSVLEVPVGFMLVGAIAIALDFSGIHRENILLALRVLLTAFGAVSAMFLLTLTTPVSEITAALERMHLPHIIIELMNMIYRFIFVLSSVQNQMHTSAKARLGYYGFRTGLRTFGSTIGNLLIVSLASANAYYDAMTARCYDGHLAFLTETKPMRARHVAVCGVLAAAALALWLLTRR